MDVHNKNFTLYCSYYDSNQIEQYNVKETENIKLLNTRHFDGDKNINDLDNYLSELTIFYYIWKHNIKSDVVGFCQYRRYFYNINFDLINNNYLQVWNIFDYDKGLYNFAINEGFNEYILIVLKKYLYDKYKFTYKDINNSLYNKHQIFMILMFCCKWDIFCDICNFIFGFLDYLLPNNGWQNKKVLNNFIQEINYCYKQHQIYMNQYNVKLRDYLPILSKRALAHIVEILINTYFTLSNKKLFHEEWHKRKDIFIEIKDNEYSLDLLKKFHNKNIYSNFGTIYYHTNNVDIKNDIIQHTDWYNLDRLKFINEATDDMINLNINQYIDVNTPYDLNINNKYSINFINE